MNFTRAYQDVLSTRLMEKTPLIQIIIGPRQVGKTTAAEEIYRQWSGSKLMISADGPTPPQAEWIKWNWDKALGMGSNTLFIVDEIQKIEGWSEQVKILFDQERGRGNLKIVLLGSSSLYLHEGINESLAGRFELINASHWTFKECRGFFGWDFHKYIRYGGYPGAAQFITDYARWQSYILNSIIEPVLSKDILGQRNVANPSLFRQCFEILLRYPAQAISLQKLLGQMRDRGNASTVKHYVDLFEKVFLIRGLQKYSGSYIKTRASSPKIVVLNPALINAYQPYERLENDPVWYGHVFESLIGAHLTLIPNSELYYWKNGNFEVDYVLKTPRETLGIEIKSGRGNEGKSLKQFSKEYPNIRCELWNHDDCLKFIGGI